jgi:hypothetical protein
MIPVDKLTAISDSLKAYRDRGVSFIKFDGRDQGNYHGNKWNDTREMLRRADATGLAEGLVLNEMIEATMRHSDVVLSRVLREEGYLEQLGQILGFQSELESLIGDARGALLDNLTAALKSISEDFGTPTSREVAICFRDAIYCIDKGLKLRWLTCESTPMRSHVALSNDVQQFADIAAFLDALRTELPFGAHLARIGTRHTAIGIKQPGRIAFLSSMGIDTVSGQMTEHRNTDGHMADPLDLDTPVERYPNWLTFSHGGAFSRAPAVVGADTHALDRLAALPRDRLIWLAMVVEMAGQRMAETDPTSVQLTESVANALPGHRASQLPVVIAPNWHAEKLTIESVLPDFKFSDWETRFLQPALEQITPELFLPTSDKPVGLRLDTQALVEWPADFNHSMSFTVAEDIKSNAVQMIRVSTDWIGSKAEVDAARRQVFAKNLLHYLMRWGNRRFAALWAQKREWFSTRLRDNLEVALAHPCVLLKDTSFDGRTGVHFYSQSLKHKTYNPRCVFNVKSEVTDILHVHPNSDTDLVEILNLKGVSQLPEELRGWTRTQGWATGHRHEDGPFGCRSRWVFKQRQSHSGRNGLYEATVCVNRANFDVSGHKVRIDQPSDD